MSRIGKIPIPIPQGVEVKVSENAVEVKGPLGALNRVFKPETVEVVLEDGNLKVKQRTEFKLSSQYQGLYRKLFSNMITGVVQGYSKRLEIEGIGYRARVDGNEAVFNLGLSYEVRFPMDRGIQIQVERNTIVTVSGIDRELVGRIAADIKAIRPPEPYKGKGIKYQNEHVRRKAGKTG